MKVLQGKRNFLRIKHIGPTGTRYYRSVVSAARENNLIGRNTNISHTRFLSLTKKTSDTWEIELHFKTFGLLFSELRTRLDIVPHDFRKVYGFNIASQIMRTESPGASVRLSTAKRLLKLLYGIVAERKIPILVPESSDHTEEVLSEMGVECLMTEMKYLLSEDIRTIVLSVYGIGVKKLTTRQLARMHGLSHQRISQIIERAEERLARGAKHLREFL